MKKKILPAFLLIFFLVLVSGGCKTGDLSGNNDSSSHIKIVTTIFPLADITDQLGGNEISTSYLLPAGSSPHTYEPTVDQARLIANADLFISIGAGLDDWSVQLARSAGSDLVLLDLSTYINLMETGECFELDEHDGHENCDHDHSDHLHKDLDPHYWLDPIIVRDQISPVITDKLINLSPDKQTYFEVNLESYRDDLSRLDSDISAAVGNFNSTGFIAFHSAWRYFANRYGLNEIAVIASFPGQEPSSGWIAELIDLINEHNIGAILTEPQFPSALADRIAEETETKIYTADPLGGSTIPGRDSYINLMRFNLDIFQKALE
ncbi:MAG: metal ABC transporter substrate-binding protein [Bacillota bacterium]|nr:metal ABC transporter substrate-binding protein [Bacillota bacterium]